MYGLTPTNIAWLFAYLVMVAGIVVGLRTYRESAITHYSTPQSTARWQDWREAAETLGTDAAVERVAPKSSEPPALVLMRDHFPACLGISILLSSCVFVWFMICARGVMRPVELNLEQDE